MQDHDHDAHDEHRSLKDIHEDVPPDYYDTSLKTNPIQRVYHNRRFDGICELVSKTPGAILDVGCDGGTLLERIADKATPSRVVALDLAAESVAYTVGKRPDFDGLVGDGEGLPFRNGAFDAIFCSEVLEHVERPDRLFAEFRRCLSPTGYAVVAVPRETPLFKFLWFFWTRFGKGKVWRHAHVQEFSIDSLDGLITSAGFKKDEDKQLLVGMVRAVRITPSQTDY
jgi:2-polyprenyl-3-methyl-5-hydroxy-6-metoxy-1,4-benzoquinol methylase